MVSRKDFGFDPALTEKFFTIGKVKELTYKPKFHCPVLKDKQTGNRQEVITSPKDLGNFFIAPMDRNSKRHSKKP